MDYISKVLYTSTLTTQSALQHWERFGIQYLVQGHLEMQTGGVRDQTTEILIGGHPALPPESQLPSTHACVSNVETTLHSSDLVLDFHKVERLQRDRLKYDRSKLMQQRERHFDF